MSAAATTDQAAPTEVAAPAPAAERPKLSPVQFAVVVLKLRLYKWQAQVLMDVTTGQPVVVVTPNESGKTSVIIVTLALWCLHEWPGATVVLTSATFRAVRTQVFAALEKHKDKFGHWTWKDTEIENSAGGRILGFATDSGANFEGFHAYPDRPLLIIKDEAKSVSDDIYQASDRCNPTMQLDISSPGGHFGRFHDGFKSPRHLKHEISVEDCPHITPERIAAMKDQYGEDSDIYRSMILGKFAKGKEDGKVVAFEDYERCLANPPTWHTGTKQVFCDFADSGDLCIVAKRDGNKITIADQWKPDGNKAGVAERFERNLRPLQDEGYKLFGDEDGTGHGYITTLNLRGIKIRGVRNDDRTCDPHYFNINAEQWWTFAKQVRECRWILPHDETLKRQACTREQNFVLVAGKKQFGREDGKLQLQPKRRSGMPSPNHADAVVGVAFDYPTTESKSYLKPAVTPEGVIRSPWEDIQQEHEAESMAGFDAGS
ncbi:MAG TPA: hypothetical protein VG838_00560 [Opitutaceae bacterium]|nr:hypothetical protein [Opitutaceae bacterium]